MSMNQEFDDGDDGEMHSHMVEVPIKPALSKFMQKTVIEFLDKVYSEVQVTVEEMARKNPEMDTPLGRFNMGQSLLLDMVSGYSRMLDQNTIALVSKLTVEFMSTQSAKQMMREKKTTPAGIM